MDPPPRGLLHPTPQEHHLAHTPLELVPDRRLPAHLQDDRAIRRPEEEAPVGPVDESLRLDLCLPGAESLVPDHLSKAIESQAVVLLEGNPHLTVVEADLGGRHALHLLHGHAHGVGADASVHAVDGLAYVEKLGPGPARREEQGGPEQRGGPAGLVHVYHQSVRFSAKRTRSPGSAPFNSCESGIAGPPAIPHDP